MASLIVFGQLGEIEVSEENFRDFHTLSAVKTRSDEKFWGFSHPSQLCKHGPQKIFWGFDRVPSPILCQLLPLGVEGAVYVRNFGSRERSKTLRPNPFLKRSVLLSANT